MYFDLNGGVVGEGEEERLELSTSEMAAVLSELSATVGEVGGVEGALGSCTKLFHSPFNTASAHAS